jgi:hypothetical protein
MINTSSRPGDVFTVSYQRQTDEASIATAGDNSLVRKTPLKVVEDFNLHLKIVLTLIALFLIWMVVFFPCLAYKLF